MGEVRPLTGYGAAIGIVAGVCYLGDVRPLAPPPYYGGGPSFLRWVGFEPPAAVVLGSANTGCLLLWVSWELSSAHILVH